MVEENLPPTEGSTPATPPLPEAANEPAPHRPGPGPAPELEQQPVRRARRVPAWFGSNWGYFVAGVVFGILVLGLFLGLLMGGHHHRQHFNGHGGFRPGASAGHSRQWHPGHGYPGQPRQRGGSGNGGVDAPPNGLRGRAPVPVPSGVTDPRKGVAQPQRGNASSSPSADASPAGR